MPEKAAGMCEGKIWQIGFNVVTKTRPDVKCGTSFGEHEIKVSPQDLNIIDKYLNGKLTPAEKIAFDKRKAEDAAFSEEVSFQQQLKEALFSKERHDLRQHIQQVRSEEKIVSINKNRRPSVWVRLSIAAVFLMLIGFVFYKTNSPVQTPFEIANNYYHIDNSIFGNLKSIGQIDDALREGIESLDKKDFQATINNLVQFPENEKAIYALAHAFYGNKEFEKAAGQFKKLSENGSPVFREKSKWYLLLSYLADGRLGGQVNDILTEIIEENGYYAQPAKEIKKSLR